LRALPLIGAPPSGNRTSPLASPCRVDGLLLWQAIEDREAELRPPLAARHGRHAAPLQRPRNPAGRDNAARHDFGDHWLKLARPGEGFGL
jgi:hypothetical protein